MTATKTFYHVAPATARESIRSYGLKASLPSDNPIWEKEADIHMQPVGVYLTESLDEARLWISRIDWQNNPALDIWEVRHPEPEYIEEDPLAGVKSFYDPEDISAECLQLVVRGKIDIFA